jgi:hypothetical protein
MREWLIKYYGIDFVDVYGDEKGYDKIYDMVKSNLKK